MIRTNVNADEAAVFGAAFKGAALSPSFRVKDIRTVLILGKMLSEAEFEILQVLHGNLLLGTDLGSGGEQLMRRLCLVLPLRELLSALVSVLRIFAPVMPLRTPSSR
jgi:hypothetical protein